MLNSAVLEVIVGLVFVYSLLSILVTQINAVITNVLKLRAKHLRDGIDDLLTDTELQAKIYTHPLIRLVEGGFDFAKEITEDQAKLIASGDVNRDVTWIPPSTFVNVLLNIVKEDSDDLLYGKLNNIIEAMPATQEKRVLRALLYQIKNSGKGLDDLRVAIGELKGSQYAEPLRVALGQLEIEIGNLEVEPEGIGALLAGLKKVKNETFRVAMQTIVESSKTVDEARQNLESWFNDGMSRASQAFGRKMQYFSLLIGLLIAVFVNVDSLQLARALWEDPALRDSLATAAQTFDTSSLTTTTTPEATPEPGASSTSTSSSDGTLAAVTTSATEARQTLQQILNLGLPIGWHWDDLSSYSSNDPLRQDVSNLWNLIPGNNPDYWLRLLLVKLVGWIATMIAIAQGAPFWFNMLNRLTGRGGSSSSDSNSSS